MSLYLCQLSCRIQAWSYMETTEDMTSLAPGLGLGAPSKVSNRLWEFPMEVPFGRWKWPCPLKDETPGLQFELFWGGKFFTTLNCKSSCNRPCNLSYKNSDLVHSTNSFQRESCLKIVQTIKSRASHQVSFLGHSFLEYLTNLHVAGCYQPTFNQPYEIRSSVRDLRHLYPFPIYFIFF